MRPLKLQFFLGYSVLGSIAPLLPIYLKEEKGFSESQIGVAMSSWSLALILSPAFVTLLADTRFRPRNILGVALVLTAVFLACLSLVEGVALTLLCYALYSMAYVPTLPLQDGYYFSSTEGREGVEPYHRIRFFGTLGFILPSVAFFFLLRAGFPREVIVYLAMGCCLFALVNTRFLPPVRKRETAEEAKGKLPSIEALRAILHPRARYFCLALVLAAFGSTAYIAYFPLYLREHVAISDAYIGLILNFGPVLELFFILGLGKLQKLLGLRWLMILGIAGMALRLFLLALFPGLLTALLVQLVHGPEILALYVLPVMYLNSLASDSFRNSMQGVFTMAVVGLPRLFGHLISGWLAEINILWTFTWGGSLALAAALLLFWRFRPAPLETGTA
ncbi:MAG: MFS transporter [Verrucomicrobiota bacterium]